LGYFGYVCKEFDTELEFYIFNFNFVLIDIFFHSKLDNVDVFTFIYIDFGREWSDYYIFFLQRAFPEMKKIYLHYNFYEMADFDIQLIGYKWLVKKGWTNI
jgi:hypothetical protein